jgi:CobQ-like glutamine amidotransferase family enzyme
VALAGRLRIVHLFPDLLRFYGDGGNVSTLVGRAAARSIETSVDRVPVGADRIPPADLVLIGGGQDREQVTVAQELERLGPQLMELVAEGAALLAVCGGYQNLGTSYRTAVGVELYCPGIFPVTTDATGNRRRLVGHVLACPDPALAAIAVEGGDPVLRGQWQTIVGFENHGGRTVLAPGARPFAMVESGHGNNGTDATEGVLLLPGEAGLRGLRIGTYLHGPLLPRNPHIADALIAAALARGGPLPAMAPLDDRLEWAAHNTASSRMRRIAREDRRIPDRAHRLIDPIKSLIGF